MFLFREDVTLMTGRQDIRMADLVLFPGYHFLSLEESLRVHAILKDEVGHTWDPCWLPVFADGAGSFLGVSHRPHDRGMVWEASLTEMSVRALHPDMAGLFSFVLDNFENGGYKVWQLIAGIPMLVEAELVALPREESHHRRNVSANFQFHYAPGSVPYICACNTEPCVAGAAPVQGFCAPVTFAGRGPRSRTLTYLGNNNPQAKANRYAACLSKMARTRIQTPSNCPTCTSCDEFPFASTREGGAGSCTVNVPLSEQRSQGGQLSSFYRNNGVRFGDTITVNC